MKTPAFPQVEEDPDCRDAESRVCAVRALGAVACKLCAVDGEAPRLRARQLLPRVCDALLMAMEDYSTDSRYAAGRNVFMSLTLRNWMPAAMVDLKQRIKSLDTSFRISPQYTA